MNERRRPLPDEATGTPHRKLAVRDLELYIESHLGGDLRVTVLANCAAMSTSSFSRWFRAQTGKTPHAYVVEARVERAKQLLRSSKLTLLEISLAVGFSSQSCLNVAFRRHAGMTPVEWRDQMSRKTKDVTPSTVRRSAPGSRLRSQSRSQSRSKEN